MGKLLFSLTHCAKVVVASCRWATIAFVIVALAACSSESQRAAEHFDEVNLSDARDLLPESLTARRLVAACVEALGFQPADESGLVTLVEEGRRTEHQKVLAACEEVARERGILASEQEDRTWQRRFDSYLIAYECLVEAGETPEEPPSRTAYMQNHEWTPFDGVPVIVDEYQNTATGPAIECMVP